jgi:Zn-dependent oligopeptidase
MSWTKYQPYQQPKVVPSPVPPALRQKKNDQIASTRALVTSIDGLIKNPGLSVADRDELRACRDLLEQRANDLAGAADYDTTIVFLGQIDEVFNRFSVILERLKGQQALSQIVEAPALLQQKDKLITLGRGAAGRIAEIMQNSGLSTTERNELRACHDRLEQYVKAVAETETTQGEAIASLAHRMADVMNQFGNIADRVQGRLALGQIAETP